MGKSRDLLIQRYGGKLDDKTDKEIHDELLLKEAKEGKLPSDLEDTYKKVMEKAKKKQ